MPKKKPNSNPKSDPHMTAKPKRAEPRRAPRSTHKDEKSEKQSRSSQRIAEMGAGPTLGEKEEGGGRFIYENVASRIRNMILTGRYSPGDKLNERDLSKETGFGAVSIRRAFALLLHEGIVEIRAKSGTFVRPVNEDELSQLWRLRTYLEELFVTTISRDTRPEIDKQLETARKINDELADLSQKIEFESSDKSEEEKAIALTLGQLQLDKQFHECLAETAGFGEMKDMLGSMRTRLQLAFGSSELSFGSRARQIIGVVDDHSRILNAIRPNPGTVGDVNEARLAIRSHLRKAADRWHLTSRIRNDHAHGCDPIFDTPDQLSSPNGVQILPLAIIRLLLELLVLAEIVQRRDVALDGPRMLHRRMRQIASKYKGVTNIADIDEYDRRTFASSDVDFHSGLALLSGLLFAEEATVYIWQRSLSTAVKTFDGDRMDLVIRDHDKILREIDYHVDSANGEGSFGVLNAMKEHLSRAMGVILKEEMAEKSSKDEREKIVEPFLAWFMKRLTASRSGGSV